jgi:multiple sugar transport system permease protein
MTTRKVFNQYLWILPVILILGSLLITPLIWTIWLSFQDKTVGGEAIFTGLKNYINVLKQGDFFDGLWKSSYFTIPSIFFKLLLGLIAALILNKPFKGRNIIRTSLFIPWTIPRFAVAIIFIWFFRNGGGLDLILTKFGITPPFWLGPKMVMPTMIYINVWKGFPFFMVGILAGLQSIPREIYEAASIDGANSFQKFWYVTLPLLRNVILILVVLSTIWTFSEFDVIYLITQGGPGTASQTLPILTYVRAFRLYDMGEAAAISVLTLPVFLALIISLVKLTERR